MESSCPPLDPGDLWTPRQRQVLEAALTLLMEAGDRLTMTSVARRARCSKETLYKWFGDRAGLLTAVVQWQASKVRVTPLGPASLDLASLTDRLEQFARDWLTVISSPTSAALNRLAAGQARTGESDLGTIVLANGRFALAARLKPVLEAGKQAGFLHYSDSEEAFRTFFGLVGRDVQIRVLLGETMTLDAAEIGRDAHRSTRQFMALYGAKSGAADSRSRSH